MSFDDSVQPWILDAQLLSGTYDAADLEPVDLSENLRMFTNTTFLYDEDSHQVHSNPVDTKPFPVMSHDQAQLYEGLIKTDCESDRLNSQYSQLNTQHQMSPIPQTYSEKLLRKPNQVDAFIPSRTSKLVQNREEEKSEKYITPEEDKRRRNTAASARFRHKKKMREMELEQTVKQLSSRVMDLENKLKEQEMENKLLKSLIRKDMS